MAYEQDFPKNDTSDDENQRFIHKCKKEPAVPLLIIPRVEDIHYCGDFDFAVMAQSPNYKLANVDYIMNVFSENIEEI